MIVVKTPIPITLMKSKRKAIGFASTLSCYTMVNLRDGYDEGEYRNTISESEFTKKLNWSGRYPRVQYSIDVRDYYGAASALSVWHAMASLRGPYFDVPDILTKDVATVGNWNSIAIAAHGSMVGVGLYNDFQVESQLLPVDRTTQKELLNHLLSFIGEKDIFYDEQITSEQIVDEATKAIHFKQWDGLGYWMNQSASCLELNGHLYAKARVTGMWGGFMNDEIFTLVAPPERHPDLIALFAEQGCAALPYEVQHYGSRILSWDGETLNG